MAHLKPVVGADKNKSLGELTAFIAGFEVALGALIKMENDGVHTVLTFDQGQPHPTPAISLTPTVAGTPIVPAGHKLVCQGDVFITGVVMNCAAIR